MVTIQEAIDFFASDDIRKTLPCLCELFDVTVNALKEFSNYKDAEKQGRIVVFPCKVGDTVFIITNAFRGNDLQAEIQNRIIDVISHNILNKNTMISKKPFELHFYPSEIGKTVFFTRQEAEKALEGME